MNLISGYRLSGFVKKNRWPKITSGFDPDFRLAVHVYFTETLTFMRHLWFKELRTNWEHANLKIEKILSKASFKQNVRINEALSNNHQHEKFFYMKEILMLIGKPLEWETRWVSSSWLVQILENLVIFLTPFDLVSSQLKHLTPTFSNYLHPPIS